jgi:hypothetical protein
MDPWGHDFLTKESVEAAMRNFPAELNWARQFLPDAAITSDVERDVTDVFHRGHWSHRGQKHHFMQFEGQGAWKAYKAGHDWIYGHAYEAVNRLRRIWKQSLHGNFDNSVRNFNSVECDPAHLAFGPFGEISCNPFMDVGDALGDALHALQDSYSSGHTDRKKVGELWIIDGIFIYNRENKKTHSARDKMWKTDEPGKEAMFAGRELIKRVVRSSVVRMDHQVKWQWDLVWGTFAARFLGQNLGSEPGRYPDRSTG